MTLMIPNLLPAGFGNETSGPRTTEPYNLLNTLPGAVGSTNISAPNPSTVGQNDGGSYQYDAAAAAAAAEKQSAIDQLNRILGNIGVQRDQGVQRLDTSYTNSRSRLDDDRSRAMLGYDNQSQQNEREKLRGTQQVDSFANSSYNNLSRILQGANAGNSSVMRDLVPQLVSKAAGQRRQGVFNTYGDNQLGIDAARNDAEDQFKESGEDLDLQRKTQKESFLRSILESEQDIYGQLQGLQSGGAASAAKAAADSRNAQLNALFTQFQPTLNSRAVNLKTPDISKYTIDPAVIKQGGNSPAETAYYLPGIKKKQQQAS